MRGANKNEESIIYPTEEGIEVELKVKELLELEAILGSSQVVGIGREMNLSDGLIVGHQMELVYDIFGQCLRIGIQIALEHRQHDLLYSTRIEKELLHLLGRVIHAHQGLLGIDSVLGCQFEFWMRYLKPVTIVILFRLAEEQIFLIAQSV